MSNPPSWLSSWPVGLQVWLDRAIERTGTLAGALDAFAGLFAARVNAAMAAEQLTSGREGDAPAARVRWIRSGRGAGDPSRLGPPRWLDIDAVFFAPEVRFAVIASAEVWPGAFEAVVEPLGVVSEPRYFGPRPPEETRARFSRALWAARGGLRADLESGVLVRDNPGRARQTSRMPSASLAQRRPGPHDKGTGRYRHHRVQSILVPRAHRDVKADGARGARRVALRHGAPRGGKMEATPNYYRFRVREPRAFVPGTFVTLALPSGTKVVKAVPASAVRGNPTDTVAARLRAGPEMRGLLDQVALEGGDVSIKDGGRTVRVKGAFSPALVAALHRAGFELEIAMRARVARPSSRRPGRRSR